MHNPCHPRPLDSNYFQRLANPPFLREIETRWVILWVLTRQSNATVDIQLDVAKELSTTRFLADSKFPEDDVLFLM